MSVALATIRANVLKELGLNSDDSTWQTRATRWINKALDKAQGFMPEAEFMQNSETTTPTVADQAIYSMPSDFLQLLSLRDDTNKNIIDIIPRREFERRHPDPSSESTGKPYECTFEFDMTTGVHVIRLAAIPDDAYTLYAVIRRFHPAISATQSLMYSKLETALEDWAIFEGTGVAYPDNEFANYRKEMKTKAVESMQSIQQVFALQKPRPDQIPTILKRSYA